MSNLGPQHINQSFGGLLQLPNGLTSSLQAVQDGSGNVTPLQISNTDVQTTFIQAGTGAVMRTMQGKARELVSVTDFALLTNAIATGGTLMVPSGIYNITSDTDFGTCSLEFAEGALFNVSDGVTVIIRNQIVAGEFQIFSTTGNIICAGTVNPMWWGAVRSTSSPGATVAAANTLAFRRAAKSFIADYQPIKGTLASPSGPQTPFDVLIPPGIFYLSNGFAAPVGVTVRGHGVNTLLCRLAANADSDTAIPLLTIGQSLAPPPGLAYDNGPVVQSESVFTSAGFTQTAAQAYNLYFVDQNPTVAAFKPSYPGCQFSDLFFTSCGISIDMSACADVTGENLVIDMGLTGIMFGATQNVQLNNVILYNQQSQAIVFGTNARDIVINGFEIEYPVSQGIYFAESNNNNDNIRFSNGMFISNIQYAGFYGMVHVRGGNLNVFFSNCNFRNVPGITVNQSLNASGVRLTFENCTWDGLRTTGSYTQGNTMSAVNLGNGTFVFKGCEFKNLFAASTTNVGACDIVVNGFKYSGMNYTGAIFNFSSGSGTADFFGVQGDEITPLITGNGLFTRVKASFDWLGAPYADSSNLAWNVPAGIGNQYFVTVTANTNSALAVESRKTATYLVDMENRYNGASFTSTLNNQVIYSSPADGSYPQCTPTFVFLGGSATQPQTYPNPTTWKVLIPNTYSNYKINVDFLD